MMKPTLAGWNGGTISNSYATGDVESESSSTSHAGELAGRSDGTISNSFATGSVSASSLHFPARSGGLVGWNHSGTIRNSYATGAVSCTTGMTCSSPSFGGLVGVFSSGSIRDSYWNTTTGLTTGCSTGTCPPNGGLTTTEMKNGMSAALGDGFQLTDGAYPKVKKCTVCTGALADFVYSTELVSVQ